MHSLQSTPADAQELHLGLVRVVRVGVRVLEIYPRVAADVDVQILVLVVTAALGLDHVQMYTSPILGPFHLESLSASQTNLQDRGSRT